MQGMGTQELPICERLSRPSPLGAPIHVQQGEHAARERAHHGGAGYNGAIRSHSQTACHIPAGVPPCHPHRPTLLPPPPHPHTQCPLSVPDTLSCHCPQPLTPPHSLPLQGGTPQAETPLSQSLAPQGSQLCLLSWNKARIREGRRLPPKSHRPKSKFMDP